MGNNQMPKERRHCKIFNLIARGFGLMLTIAGLVAGIDGVLLIRNPNEFGTVDTGQTMTGSHASDLFGVCVIALVGGLMFMIARP
jgi:hypothetical protein